MIVALGSMFRNSTPYLLRYFEQVIALRDVLTARGDRLRLILAEGDSTDATWELLAKFTNDFDAVLIKKSHGRRVWGSEDVPDRWEALAWVCNGILDHVTADVDQFIYVESDLVWPVETMTELLLQVEAGTFMRQQDVAVSPMSLAGETELGPTFYDLWGMRIGDEPFGPFPPYHPQFNPHGLTRLDSTGSCVAMTGALARRVRFGDGDQHFRGFGKSVYNHGGSLWLDPTVAVRHV